MERYVIRITADYSKDTNELRKAFLALRPRLRQLEMQYGLFDPARIVTVYLSPRLHNKPPNQTAHTPGARPRDALTRKWDPIRISGNRMEKERERDEGRHARE
ncbi:hypothetical protein NDU88_005843 [Pleurodeles waltl]|uniref:Uncharacterized protein n=1 Tax=Pleurodeles waltl TaxID=8319 RepID=A0AAV7RKU2_PLEWA|nr:hypothetical protein NDU88_005843 [Pleurodeles waltl]